jgi:hypothetical protein
MLRATTETDAESGLSARHVGRFGEALPTVARPRTGPA